MAAEEGATSAAEADRAEARRRGCDKDEETTGDQVGAVAGPSGLSAKVTGAKP